MCRFSYSGEEQDELVFSSKKHNFYMLFDQISNINSVIIISLLQNLEKYVCVCKTASVV